MDRRGTRSSYISLLLTAIAAFAVFGCGGSGPNATTAGPTGGTAGPTGSTTGITASTTGSTATTAGSTAGSSFATFATPVAATWSGAGTPYSSGLIYGVSPSGAVVGFYNGFGEAYAPSATAPPQLLKGDGGIQPNGINSSGVIVGLAQVGTGAAVWLSPDASPLALPTPPGATQSEALAINSSGQILGYYISPQSVVPVVVIWNDYTSLPTTTVAFSTGVPGASLPVALNDAGDLFTQVNSSYWTSPTRYQSLLAPLPTLSPGSKVTTKRFSFSNYGAAGTCSDSKSGISVATVWAAPGFSPMAVPFTSNFGQSAVEGMNDAGEMVGSVADISKSVGQAVFWQPGRTQLNLMPQLTAAFPQVVYGVGEVIFGDGSVIVEGQDSQGNVLGFYYMKRLK